MNPALWDSISMLGMEEFREQSKSFFAKGYRPLALFGLADSRLIQIMANDAEHKLLLFGTKFPTDKKYPALSSEIPAYYMFERELWEEHNIIPEGHPWLKPLRYPFERADLRMEEYPFYTCESPAIHEVGVGPVHAGVIEPGHFRFLCEGEDVHHLEIQLGYQHRGVQKLFEKGDLRHKIHLSECIAGDSVIAHALAYCRLLESMGGLKLSLDIHRVRAIALEMERIAMHLADLSALAGDIAYLSGQNFLAALRTTVINSSLYICGSRYGKRWLCPGGINYGISEEQKQRLLSTFKDVSTQFNYVAKAMFADSGVLSRFDGTGILEHDTVKELGITGMAAKSAGLKRDSRVSFPFEPYQDFQALHLEKGDVYCRALLRYQEINQSLGFVTKLLEELAPVIASSQAIPDLPEAFVGISISEGFRGEVIHIAVMGAENKALAYKIYDPSFHNWTALAMAVRANGISDFPVCNKSFNLSYCGVDL